MRECADQRARGIEQQPDRDHRLAAVAVRPASERYLQHRLREPVGAHREPEQHRGVVRHRPGVQREHRQQQEQPQHARRVDCGERTDRAALLRRERRLACIVVGSDWRCLLGSAYISRLPGGHSNRTIAMDVIRIRGARTHNLQGIDLDLPRDRLIVITGLSGSGKSSLAFDTIYAEGQRRYVESLSAYARQFLSVMEKPDVDHIEGLSPAIAIEQKATSHNPRSTVGTVTEIYDYLRVLFARAGMPRCPEHGQELAAQSVSQMVDQVLALPGRHGRAAARPGRAGPQGRARRGARTPARPGVRARVRRRQAGRARFRAEARPPPATLDRRGRGPAAGAAGRGAAARRVLRDRARAFAGRGTARLPGRAGPRPGHVLEPLRLHHLRLQPRRARAAPVLVQQPERRLRHLRRPRGAGILRPGSSRGESRALAGRRRGARLGPSQRVLLPADPVAGEALPLRHRGRLERPARDGAARAALGQRRRAHRVPLLRRTRQQHEAQPRLGGHPAEPGAPLPRDRVGDRARGARQVPRYARVRRLRRQPAEPRRAQRVRRRTRAARHSRRCRSRTRGASSRSCDSTAGAARSPTAWCARCRTGSRS